jgi:hypothetical protein
VIDSINVICILLIALWWVLLLAAPASCVLFAASQAIQCDETPPLSFPIICLPLDSMHTSFSRGSRHPLNSCIRLGIGARRYYAIQTPGAPTVNVFNNRAKWLQKERAASNVHLSRQADYLRDEVAFRLCERLLVWRFIALDRGAMLTMVRTSIATSIMFSTLAQTPATLRAS